MRIFALQRVPSLPTCSKLSRSLVLTVDYDADHFISDPFVSSPFTHLFYGSRQLVPGSIGFPLLKSARLAPSHTGFLARNLRRCW
jgi:hypothetical protein